MKVDALATLSHYAAHIAPIWHALPEENRGNFYTVPGGKPHIERHGIEPAVITRRAPRGDITLVAAYRDLRRAYRLGRKCVYMQHGNGQTFREKHHLAYLGGKLAPGIELVLVPHQRCLEVMTTEAKTAVIGCPKLDKWHPAKPKTRGKPPVVAISWHWDGPHCPETRSAWPHYQTVLPLLKTMEDAGEITVLGHGHPLLLSRLVPEYERLGIAWTADFEEVLETADVYVNDSSSTLYEFCSLDRPAVVMNAPWYRRDVEHGLRFWANADVGVQVDHPDEVPAAIRRALKDPRSQQKARKRGVEAAYAFTDGRCAERAAEAILAAL